MQLPGIKLEFPQKKWNFQGLGSSKHIMWGHWAVPKQLSLHQSRGKSGSVISEDFLSGMLGCPLEGWDGR